MKTESDRVTINPSEAEPGSRVIAPERRLTVIRDKYGRLWLCPESVDQESDLKTQGCWRCAIPNILKTGWSMVNPHQQEDEKPAGDGKVPGDENNTDRR